jgi:phage terminase large subunit GpA-like protein
MPIGAFVIDSGGHHTQEVYAFARQHRYLRVPGDDDAVLHVLAIKGQSQANKPVLGKPSDVDINWKGQRLKRGVQLWPIGTDTAKAEIYGRLRNAQPGPGFVLISKHHHPLHPKRKHLAHQNGRLQP